MCNICLTKGHFANKCQKGRSCVIGGCGKQHHPLLHSDESTGKVLGDKSAKGKEREPTEMKSADVRDVRAIVGASVAMKKQICLRVIPVKVFSQDNGREKITDAIRGEGESSERIIPER